MTVISSVSVISIGFVDLKMANSIWLRKAPAAPALALALALNEALALLLEAPPRRVNKSWAIELPPDADDELNE
jgi:hypothetical protein